MNELLSLCAMNIFFFSIVLWRIELIRESVQDDIAAIERLKYLDEHDSIHPMKNIFGDGSEK